MNKAIREAGKGVCPPSIAANAAQTKRTLFIHRKRCIGGVRGVKTASRVASALAGILCLSALLTGCESTATEMPVYSLGSLPETGYFIRTGENFYPVYADGLSFNDTPETGALDKRYFEQSGKEAMIPTLKAGDELVYRSVSQELPSVFAFEEMTDRGYTLGCKFAVNEDGLGVRFDDGWVKNTSAYTELNDRRNLSAYTVLELNNETLQTNLIDENGIIPGLTPEKQYLLGTFEGTVYREITVLADTRYYTSYAVRTVDKEAPYSLTRKGYAVVTLPANLESGLYAINGEGVFFYDAGS